MEWKWRMPYLVCGESMAGRFAKLVQNTGDPMEVRLTLHEESMEAASRLPVPLITYGYRAGSGRSDQYQSSDAKEIRWPRMHPKRNGRRLPIGWMIRSIVSRVESLLE